MLDVTTSQITLELSFAYLPRRVDVNLLETVKNLVD